MKLIFACFSLLSIVVNSDTDVYAGESIQDAIDNASPGDTITVHTGVYKESGLTYGVRIDKSLRLVGDGNVTLEHDGSQETGLYIGPTGCDYKDDTCPLPDVPNVSIENIIVKGFPQNGIMTRWVDGFEYINCKSIDNEKNGLYATRSKNGLMKDSFSSGSWKDTAGWTSACVNVTVEGCEFTGAPTGFQFTVSKDIIFKNNHVHGNSVGVGLYHPDATANPLMSDMSGWIVKENLIEENNLPNPANPTAFAGSLPSGVGVMVLGTSGHEVVDNQIIKNFFGGIVMLGWCTTRQLTGLPLCGSAPGIPRFSPSANNNLVKGNFLKKNGKFFPSDRLPTGGTPVDILCAGSALYGEDGQNNCFQDNVDPDQLDEFAFSIGLSGATPVDLPTGGCDSGVSGDPHIKTWSGIKYDFHGVCDLVLLQNPDFQKGMGMDIHVRTKQIKQFSYVSSAVLRIGGDTLEVMGDLHENLYWINKEANGNLDKGINGYQVSSRKVNSQQYEFIVDLGNGESIVFKTFKKFVRVSIEGATQENFGSSLGLMGSFRSGKMFARDNSMVLEDTNVFGQEWQVLASEDMLFHSVEGPQAPAKCDIPLTSTLRRRLADSSISAEEAEIACARVSQDDFDTCVFDVMATGDKDVVGAY